MDLVKNYPQGYYQVGNKLYINKHTAMVEAVNNHNNEKISYHFFDESWTNFDRNKIGQYSLNELYRQRAQQLRNQYDYLILYFSGGADSYNVLRSFCDNNIHLDEICVKWCTDVFNSNRHIYTPNTVDLTSYNYLSEWDYAIKPVLEWVAQHHSDIKITILDWFKDRDSTTIANAFALVNHFHDCEINSLAIWSPNEARQLELGKTVGSIYGIDKPNMFIDTNSQQWKLFFSDTTVAMGTPNPDNVWGTEYFYITPNMPEIIFEMAHQLIIESRNNNLLAQVLDIKTANNMSEFQVRQKIVRHILYNNWTDRFQCFKPTIKERSDKHFWIYRSDELSDYKNLYEELKTYYDQQLEHSRYRGQRALIYQPLNSAGFPICPK
jgi:hypothetical protein